jgi:hypothetical protein
MIEDGLVNTVAGGPWLNSYTAQTLTRPDLGPLSIVMTRLLAICWHGDEEASWCKGMHCAHAPEEFYIHFATVSSECTNRVNVYDRGKMLPGQW